MAILRRTCPGCNGTGQVSYFKGESRFLLTEEDCSECAGMGFVIFEEDDEAGAPDTGPAGTPETPG